MAFAVGKWTQETCREMIADLVDKVHVPEKDHRVQFFSDGNDDYTYVLPEFFDKEFMDYGQLVKIRERGTLVGKERRIVFGSPNKEDIETTDVENFNGILRERVGRLVRKSKCFSKRKKLLGSALHLFQFYWNFMSNIRRGITPAMIEGLTGYPWSWNSFFYSKLNHLN